GRTKNWCCLSWRVSSGDCLEHEHATLPGHPVRQSHAHPISQWRVHATPGERGMQVHEARVHPSAPRLPPEAQLTWKIAQLASAAPPPEGEVANMVACRVVDNAGVALAAINRQPVATARVMALAHPRPHGATLFGLPAAVRVQAEWACWANATAV